MPTGALSQPKGEKPLATKRKPIRFGINTFVGLISAVLIQILGWIGTKLLFIHLVPSGSATYSYGLNLLGTVSFLSLLFAVVTGIGGFRIGNAMVFFVARGADRRPLVGTYIIWHSVTFSILSSIIVILALQWGWVPAAYLVPLVLFVVLVPLLHVLPFAYSAERTAMGQAALGLMPNVVEAVVRMGLIVYFVFPYSPGQTPLTLSPTAFSVAVVTKIAIAYVFGAFAGFLFSTPILRDISFRNFWPTLRDLFSYATPLMLAMLLTFSVTLVTPAVVKALAGFAVFQAYSSVNAFLILLMFLPNAVVLPLFPTLARLHAEGRMVELRQRVTKAIRYTFLILAPGIVVISVYRVDLLNLMYNASLIPLGANAMIVVSIATLPMALFLITGTTLDAVGLQRREFYASAVQLIAIFTSLVFLVPRYNVVGATLSVVLGSMAGLAMNVWYLHRNMPIHVPYRSVITVLAASAATFALFSNTIYITITEGVGQFLHLRVSVYHIPVQYWYVLIPVIALGTLVYGCLLLVIGEITKEDVLELTQSAGLPDSLGRALAKFCWKSRPSK